MSTLRAGGGRFGTLPVFMTAISTILGAILFLRFGYAVGHLGFLGALAVIVIGHIVTLPTALAVAEIATNQKVEGGGAYYIISRSFGLNIGAAIGIALFLSQAISVAFYVIAFGEAFEPVIEYFNTHYDYFVLKKKMITLGMMAILAALMLTKGANIGVKALYFVVAILFISLLMFFAGTTDYRTPSDFITDRISSPHDFFHVFTIIFPAFTGIAAGLGLSGDLRDPKRSIPRGTIWATIGGIVVYIAIAYKMAISADPYSLANDQMYMSKIALWGPIIPIGLACASLSSALGSILIAPRTLQALGSDKIFSLSLNTWLGRGRKKDNEPVNASVVTTIIAFGFVLMGELDFVAEIISMFFMVTYGAICMVSFLEHFAADPAYRPTFRSKWYWSLIGAVASLWLMFGMNSTYAVLSILIMVGIYWYINKKNAGEKGMVKLFKGVLFQLSREMQIFIQKRDFTSDENNWRPFVICITEDSFKRQAAFDMIRWLSYKYGFGTYIHYIKGFLSRETRDQSVNVKARLIKLAEGIKSRVYLDTIISPSYTSAIAQSIQLPGISGKGNNMILFEFARKEPERLDEVLKNYDLLKAADFDVCVLNSSFRGFGYRKEIHIWITSTDFENANLMILLGYILLGHPDWKDGVIKIFSLYPQEDLENKKERLSSLIKSGRLPISPNNIELIEEIPGVDYRKMINQNSVDADLTIIGFSNFEVKSKGKEVFNGYDDLGNILFVNATKEKDIE